MCWSPFNFFLFAQVFSAKKGSKLIRCLAFWITLSAVIRIVGIPDNLSLWAWPQASFRHWAGAASGGPRPVQPVSAFRTALVSLAYTQPQFYFRDKSASCRCHRNRNHTRRNTHSVWSGSRVKWIKTFTSSSRAYWSFDNFIECVAVFNLKTHF